MRPVERGPNPLSCDFDDYRDALPYLVGRLGNYCSYCERWINSSLHIDHIQPKGLSHYYHLIGFWDNFLLACVNCNSTKGDKDISFDNYFFPDRDNVFVAFEYASDGRVFPNARLNPDQMKIAKKTLELTGLDKRHSRFNDENGELVILDRESWRANIWLEAVDSLNDLAESPTDLVRGRILRLALKSGGFSIWMKVFENDSEMRQRFIDEFPGTARDCFDEMTRPISPRPNNGLEGAGKA